MERLSQGYWVDASYPMTWIAYSRPTRRIPPSITLLRNDIQAHLLSTLLSSVMVSHLTPHPYSIKWLI
jgi:hypothetical protein